MVVQIKFEGYGLEIALGRIEQEVFDYFIEKNLSLTDFVNGDIEVPEKYRPFESEAWFECDDITHVHGLQLENDGKITISEGSKILAEFNATYDELAENDIEFEEENDFYISELTEEGPIFYGKNQEKGTFFFTEMKIENFDISKISIETVDIEEIEIVSKVLYDGKELKNFETQTKSLGGLELSFES